MKVIISGIGTGGHYFPALVIAQEFLSRNLTATFLVRQGYPEEEIALLHNLPTFRISARPFYGKPILTKLLFLLSLLYSTYRLNALTKDSIGFSCGGFGSLPLILSCLINRRPFYLFEPNRIPGRATRLFGPFARKVFLGMPVLIKIRGQTIITGIPLRKEFKELKPVKEDRGPTKKRILFIGGSQGAKRLNEFGLKLQKILPAEYQLVIISGPRDYKWLYKQHNARTEVIPWTQTPWQEFEKADLIISRAGALAGYEIVALKKKAIFIPFPYAVDNHQYHNALFFAKMGQGICLEEKDLNELDLAQKIEALLNMEMENVCRLILDAEKRIVDEVEKDLAGLTKPLC